MSNILDYVNWRGDLSFEEANFNEVDNLIFSCISYLDFENIADVEDFGDYVLIGDAADIYFEKYDVATLSKYNSMIGSIAETFKIAAHTKRFGNIKMWNYKNNLDYEKKTQFSAVSFEIKENFYYISFRGTDNTLVGWQEDFNMSFMPVVPAQKNALEYLSETAEKIEGEFIVGGHSKGGNLAVYSAVKCSENIQKRILKVYNNDGPGFDTDMIESEEYLRILPKINTIVPESSVIGMLLEHNERYTVVKSSRFWIFQHDATSWEVMGNSFVHKDDVNNSEKLIDKSIKSWLKSMTEKERKHFVTSLFDVLESTGAKTIDDLANNGIKNLALIKKSLSILDKENKVMVLKLIIKILEIVKIKIFN